MEHAARAGADQFARHIAGGDDAVPGVVRHPHLRDLFVHGMVRARRIGDEHDASATLSGAAQRFDSPRESDHAIVDHPPDIAEDRAITRRNLIQTPDHFRHVIVRAPVRPARVRRASGD